MNGILDKISRHLVWEDIFDFVRTIWEEHQELVLIVIALIFIIVLCLWTLLERLEEKGYISLIPLYRFVVLFSKIEIKPALAVLFIIPGINIIMRTVFYVKLAKKFNRSYFWVPFLCILPFPCLAIVAFGDGHCPHIKIEEHLDRREKRLLSKKQLVRNNTFKASDSELVNAGTKNVEMSDNEIDKILQEEMAETPKGEENRVLSMAELKTRKIQNKEEREQIKRGSANAFISPQTGDNKAGDRVKAANLMPEMRQGPKGQMLSELKKKGEAERVKNAEESKREKNSQYERLLKAQKAAAGKRIERLNQIEDRKRAEARKLAQQKLKQERAKKATRSSRSSQMPNRGRKNMDMVVRKTTSVAHKSSPRSPKGNTD